MNYEQVVSRSLRTFMQDQRRAALPRSMWFNLHAGLGEVYMRAGKYAFDPADGQFHTCLGLSHIVVAPKHRQSGVFRRLLSETIEQARALGYERVRVEQVSYDWLIPCIERAGLTLMPGEGQPSFEIEVSCRGVAE